MEKSNLYKRLWAHPDFVKKIKIEAAENDMSIFDYTRKKANEEVEECNEKKPFRFKL